MSSITIKKPHLLPRQSGRQICMELLDGVLGMDEIGKKRERRLGSFACALVACKISGGADDRARAQ
jgi:hypothetical protein